ncbi:MAG: response regulator [Oligoflexia bacterium]|nr:response regulator [Oligoflexia bacterium]
MTPRILLAEDEEHIARLIAFKLTKEGFEITVARDGGEALALLETHAWTLAILDVMMPVHDGWAVLRALRARSAIPVLMLTARGDAQAVSESARLGATHFMKKPFDLNELAATVKRLAGSGS